MKKTYQLTLAALMALSLTACGSQTPAADSTTVTESSTAETTLESISETLSETDAQEETDMAEVPVSVMIKTLNASKEEIELEVPFNPERIAVLDLASLDILDNLGVGDRVVGLTKSARIDYLESYVLDEDIINLGTIKEASLEAVMECEPDVIFIGGRLSSSYDALSQIAPVVFIATNVEEGLVNSVGINARTIASMFGLEDQVSDLLKDFDARISALAEAADGQTAIIGMVTSGGFNVVGNNGRCSLIGNEIGFENVGNVEESSTHGNESSFELLVSIDPDYIFVMDRDAAIATEGAKLAQEIMENELVMMTSAYENDNIVYLEHPSVWYTAEGGVSALDTMLSDLETALLP